MMPYKFNSVIWFGIIAAFSSCSVSTHYGVYSWENSNASLIERSVPCEQIVALLDSALLETDRLVVVSEETPASGDKPILAGIEAQLIRELLNSGVTILERDDDLISKIISESAENYVVLRSEESSYSGVSATEISGRSFGSSGNFQQGNSTSYSSSVTGGGGAVAYGIENWSRTDSTSLLSANRILSYRVLECGVQKEVEGGSSSGYPIQEIGRNARTVLDIKLINANSGEILLAERVIGVEEYEPSEGDVEIGIDPSFRYYSFGSPLQNGNPEAQKVREGGSQRAVPKWPIMAFGLLITIIALTL